MTPVFKRTTLLNIVIKTKNACKVIKLSSDKLFGKLSCCYG